MDLLKTLALYMTMIFASSVQAMPDPEAFMVQYATPTPEVVQATAAPEATPVPTPVPTVQVSPNPAYGVLQIGDKGDEVLRLQQTLTEYGYYDGDLDGRYGNQTRMAVEKFQYYHGLYADGIAGKYTLSVLYDSDQVRYAAATPTPPPPADNLTVALPTEPVVTEAPATETPVPETPAPETPVPETPVPETPVPQATEAPATEPPAERLPIAAMEGWVIRLAETDAPLVSESRKNGENVTEPVLPCLVGETVYLPLVPVLEAKELMVISSLDRLDKQEIGFAMNDHLYRLAFVEDREGDPIDLEAYCDETPMPLKDGDIREVNGIYYLPSGTFTALTGLAAAADETARIITIGVPAAE